MLASDTKVSKIRVRCVGREGQAVWLEDCFFSCEPDEQGRPRKLIAYTSNITSRCEKEARIRSLEERNRKIVSRKSERNVFERPLDIVTGASAGLRAQTPPGKIQPGRRRCAAKPHDKIGAFEN